MILNFLYMQELTDRPDVLERQDPEVPLVAQESLVHEDKLVPLEELENLDRMVLRDPVVSLELLELPAALEGRESVAPLDLVDNLDLLVRLVRPASVDLRDERAREDPLEHLEVTV